ncbi:hypothetical protein D3C74_374950 [compost metagenome]
MGDLLTLYFRSLTARCIRYTGTVTNHIYIGIFRDLVVFIQDDTTLRVFGHVQILYHFYRLNACRPDDSIR